VGVIVGGAGAGVDVPAARALRQTAWGVGVLVHSWGTPRERRGEPSGEGGG